MVLNHTVLHVHPDRRDAAAPLHSALAIHVVCSALPESMHALRPVCVSNPGIQVQQTRRALGPLSPLSGLVWPSIDPALPSPLSSSTCSHTFSFAPSLLFSPLFSLCRLISMLKLPPSFARSPGPTPNNPSRLNPSLSFQPFTYPDHHKHLLPPPIDIHRGLVDLRPCQL